MDIFVALATFIVIFPAELPDKSMFAAVVMGSRFNPLAVWIGLAAAFLLHVTIAVLAGGLISLLPEKLVIAIVTTFFLAGALYLWFSKEEGQQEEGESEGSVATKKLSKWQVVVTAFSVTFVSEWGDLTQIATINLTARYGDPLSVAIGAVTALWLVTGLGVLLGNRLVRVVPMRTVRRISAAVLLALAIWSFVDFLQA